MPKLTHLLLFQVNQNMSETDPAFRHIVVNEVHNFNDNGTGKSTILINSINSHPETIYKCRVVLNDHSVCIGDTSGIAEGVYIVLMIIVYYTLRSLDLHSISQIRCYDLTHRARFIQ